MTGNTRQGIGLLILAALVALGGVVFSGAENDLGALLLLIAAAVAAIGLVKLLVAVMSPERD